MGVVLGLLNVRAFHGLHVESALVRAQRVTDPERPLCFGQFIPEARDSFIVREVRPKACMADNVAEQ